MTRKRPVTNKDFASLFYALFVMFVLLYTLFGHDYVALFYAGYSLMFALAFKTWDIIREGL